MPILGIIASQISGHLTPPDTGAMFPLGMVSVGSAGSSTITFSSIPSTYKHLQVRAISRTNLASPGFASLTMELNSDTTSNYAWHRMWGNGSTANAGATASDSSMLFGVTSGDQNIANSFSIFICDILDYTSTSKNKTIRALTGGDDNTGSANGYIGIHSGLWFKTPEAVTTVTIKPGAGQSFKQYSSFALYGI